MKLALELKLAPGQLRGLQLEAIYKLNALQTANIEKALVLL